MEMRAERRALDKIYKRRDRYEIPDWQRSKVWGTDQKRQLIDTILRGWKLPKFYFLKTSDNPEEFEVVDGQQRLSAIWEFMDGELTLSSEQTKEFSSANYANLPDKLSDGFDDFEIEYDEITDASDEDVKEFFQRLQKGLPLTGSEKLNAIHSKLRNYCVKAAGHKFFSETTVISMKRHSYFDVMAKVSTLELEGLDAGLRYEDVKMVFESNSNFSPNSAVARRINSALSSLHESFPRSHKPFKNRTIVQSIITLLCHLQASGFRKENVKQFVSFVDWFLNELRSEVKLGQAATDHTFIEFQRTVNATVKSGARTRQSILLRHLFSRNPKIYSVLSLSSDLIENIEDDIAEQAREIRQLVAKVNEVYSAVHGRDLFKSTNKTTKALMSAADVIDSYDSYKELIEGLYFVFKEGVGQRLDGSVPGSFLHVNESTLEQLHLKRWTQSNLDLCSRIY